MGTTLVAPGIQSQMGSLFIPDLIRVLQRALTALNRASTSMIDVLGVLGNLGHSRSALEEEDMLSVGN